MYIPLERVKQLLAEAPKLGHRSQRRTVDQLTGKLRREIRCGIDKHMQAWMVLVDEAVQFFIHFEKYQYSRQLSEETVPFVMQISRTRSTLLSIRELIALGQESPAQALGRIFVEDLEMSMALAEDSAFAKSYADAVDTLKFWQVNIGYGEINARVERFIRLGGGSADECEDRLKYHRSVKSYFSKHIHGDHSVALRVAFAPALSQPGQFYTPTLGALSTNLPHLCMFIADEVHMFSACCINLFTKPSPPAALANYEHNDTLNDFIASAHVLQKLMLEYSEDLYCAQDRITRNELDDEIFDPEQT